MTITKNGWVLRRREGEQPVNEGDVPISFRGERYIAQGGQPPHKPGSTGRIWVRLEGDAEGQSEFYPGVFDCEWAQLPTGAGHSSVAQVEVHRSKGRKARMEVVTRDYELSHGRKPRGTGTWAFYFSERDREQGATAAWWAEGTVTYGEAKKQAANEARRRNASRVWVGP